MWEGVHCIHVAQDMDQQMVLMNVLMNFWGPQHARNNINKQTTTKFWHLTCLNDSTAKICTVSPNLRTNLPQKYFSEYNTGFRNLMTG